MGWRVIRYAGRRHHRRSRWAGPLTRRWSVKPSAKPTLVRTQHLPHKTPGQARSGCSRRPGLRRVRERSGRPLPVTVGQSWARSAQVSRSCGRGSRGRRPGGCDRPNRSLQVSFSQVTVHVAGSGRADGSSCVPLGPAVARTPDGQNQAGFTPDSWANCEPVAGQRRGVLAPWAGWRADQGSNHQQRHGECQARLQRRTPGIPRPRGGASPAASHEE